MASSQLSRAPGKMKRLLRDRNTRRPIWLLPGKTRERDRDWGKNAGRSLFPLPFPFSFKRTPGTKSYKTCTRSKINLLWPYHRTYVCREPSLGTHPRRQKFLEIFRLFHISNSHGLLTFVNAGQKVSSVALSRSNLSPTPPSRRVSRLAAAASSSHSYHPSIPPRSERCCLRSGELLVWSV